MANFAIASFLLSAACCYAAPLKGTAMAPRLDGVDVLNEPCYVHDAACDGYPVCCVTAGTCISAHSGTISSNKVYYEGGCQSLESRSKSWAEGSGCTQQGECMVQHIEVCKGGTTKDGYMTALPPAVMERFMTDSCETSCPNENYGHRTSPQTGTTTTTTTVKMTIQGEFTMSSSDASKMDMTEEKKAELFGMLIAHMAGSGVSTSMVDHSIETSGTSNTVSFTITMSDSDATKAQQAKDTVDAALKGYTKTQMDDVMSKIVGTCDYTLSASGSVCVDTPAKCEAPTSYAARSMSVIMSMVALVFIIASGI